MKEVVGSGVGPEGELRSEDGERDVGDRGAASYGQERVFGACGRPRGQHRESGCLEPGIGQGERERERGAGLRRCGDGGGLKGPEKKDLLGEVAAELPNGQAVEEAGTLRRVPETAVGQSSEMRRGQAARPDLMRISSSVAASWKVIEQAIERARGEGAGTERPGSTRRGERPGCP